MKYIIAYDLGTGGTKASLFNENGESVASSFESCDTFFPDSGYHEQNPEHWWENVKISTKKMLEKSGVCPEDILSLAVSGHSLGVVPIGKNGQLLHNSVPIWSDSRAVSQAEEFFNLTDEEQWYLDTGNGFPPALYSIFKIMWYKDNMPLVYSDTDKFIGTKDYINYKMTGVLCTDRSYASGSGVYSLKNEKYSDEYIKCSGIEKSKLPEILPSVHVIGEILPEIAEELGLSAKTKVCAGGVDNACMALGAACINEGDVYTSLGTSAWIAVTGSKPVVNSENRTYVFAHCLPGLYVSAMAIFAAGNSFRWVRNNLCGDLIKDEENGGENSYKVMDKMAESSPVGANKLIFNPSLAGGSGLDKSENARGCFTGLDLRHTKADIIRATLEGVCMNLKLLLEELSNYIEMNDNMLIVGGGGKSQFWRQLFADIYEKNIIETNIGEDAGSLGAAAVAAVGVGLWSEFDMIKKAHTSTKTILPREEERVKYKKILPLFSKIADIQSDIGDDLNKLKLD